MNSDTEHAREIMRDMLDKRDKGYARLFGMFMSILIASWAFTGVLAVYDHRQIKSLEQQIEIKRTLPANTVISHGLIVTKRISEWVFTAWTLNPATHKWLNVPYNVCESKTFKLSNQIQPGVTLTLFQYQVDHVHSCMDMSNDRFAGYTYEVENDGITPTLTSYTTEPSTPESGQAAQTP